MFYNTENFFDTIKDPKTDDAEFTPGGKDHWTSERYQHKLDNISKVLAAMSQEDAPLVIGLAEVENKKVSEDLANQPALKKYDLDVIEQDSPDPRGIDVALLYSRKLFTVVATEFLTVKLPTDKGTRDILYVKGTMKGQTFHFFVNHWPSRRDGKEASQPKRFAAATVIKEKVATITALDKDARIVILGDFNDNPTDSSVTQILGANEVKEPFDHSKLYDLMAKPYKDGKYSLKYHQENDVFDQMVVSETLIDKASPIHVKGSVGNIFKEKWMLFDHPKYGEMPNRTYSGPRYYGGFSDHLPVYIDIEFGK
jgi:endonuclease/exonuclease/phosphatase family metal-dependent hydrolase